MGSSQRWQMTWPKVAWLAAKQARRSACHRWPLRPLLSAMLYPLDEKAPPVLVKPCGVVQNGGEELTAARAYVGHKSIYSDCV